MLHYVSPRVFFPPETHRTDHEALYIIYTGLFSLVLLANITLDERENWLKNVPENVSE